jgi:hypothetical protein
MINKILGSASRMVGKLPLVGRVLSPAVMAVGGALFGAVGVVPTHYALKYAAPYIPAKAAPFSYTLVAALLAGVAAAFVPNKFPYRGALIGAVAASGGAVDAYRFLIGRSATLGGDYGDGLGYVYAEDFGDDENVRPGEFSDSDLMDAQYSGDDFSPEETLFAGYGRSAYRKRFLGSRWMRKGTAAQAGQATATEEGMPGASGHAGRPGGRWGWLIYWIGFEQFKNLTKLDPARRKQVIASARNAAMQTARTALESGVTDGDTSMESMQAAGLLVAA